MKSQFLLVNFHFFKPQYQINRARFHFVFNPYVQFGTQIVVLYFFRALAANVFSSPRKFGPNAQHQPVYRFTSHHHLIDLNYRQKLQYLPNKVSIFE